MSAELDAYDVPPSGQEAQVLAWVEEGLQLRHGAANDDEGTLDRVLDVNTPQEVLHQLRRVQTRADRVEYLLVQARRARRRAKSLRDRVQFEASNRRGEALIAEGGRRIEFQSADERRAVADLASIEERRHAYQAQRLVDITEEAYEVLNTIHWGLTDLRKGLSSALEAFKFESSISR